MQAESAKRANDAGYVNGAKRANDAKREKRATTRNDAQRANAAKRAKRGGACFPMLKLRRNVIETCKD